MRRLLALLVVAVVGAGAFGWSQASSGVRVDGQQIGAGTLRSELAAIAASPTLQCFLTALGQASFSSGAGGDTLSASGAAAWTNLRLEGLAIERYVATKFHYRATPYRLTLATSSLEGELTQAAAAHQFTCPGSSAQALAAMPAEMRAAEVGAQAASLYLVGRLNSTIPLTSASLRAYYSSHLSQYDTLCISIALVLPGQEAAFAAAQQAGASVTALVTRFSQDPTSRAVGGAYGCYAPGQSAYGAVRHDVGTAALGSFAASPPTVSANGLEYLLYVAPTKRSVTPFASAASQVYADIQGLNAASAGVVKENILYRAAVAVDPAFGRWGLSTSGPGVFAPATPGTATVLGASVLAGTRGATYK